MEEWMQRTTALSVFGLPESPADPSQTTEGLAAAFDVTLLTILAPNGQNKNQRNVSATRIVRTIRVAAYATLVTTLNSVQKVNLPRDGKKIVLKFLYCFNSSIKRAILIFYYFIFYKFLITNDLTPDEMNAQRYICIVKDLHIIHL